MTPPLPLVCPECGIDTALLPGRVRVPHAPGCSFRSLTRTELAAYKREPVTDAWPLCPYICRRCNHPARHHPNTRLLMGCLYCGYSTSAMFAHFDIPHCTFCGHYASDHRPACPLPRFLPGRAATPAATDSHYCNRCHSIHPLKLKVLADYPPI